MTNEAIPSPSFDPFAGPAIAGLAPSTEPQREIWTACELGPDASLAFNESITVRLKGELNRSALVAAFADLVERHEALRTTFSGDGMTQCVGAPFVPNVTEHDLAGRGIEAALKEVAAIAEREVEQPFDLVKGPLFRVHVARIADKEHGLVFTAHHIVCDGWSTAVLVRDLASLYNARIKGQPPTLPVADAFSAYARQRASEGPRVKDEEYWVKQFAGQLPILDLPSDRPRPPRKTYHAAREDAVLEPELVAQVRKAGAKARASLFATLLAAFKLVVYRLTAQDDLVIGIPVAGQAAEGRTELVGHCVNMLPLRSSLREDEPFVDLLGRVRKTLLDATERQNFTFGTLLSKLPIGRDPSRLPLVSVIFNVDRGMTSDAIGFDGIEAELKGNPRKYENFDLFVNAVEIRGGVELECQYNVDLFDRTTIQRWIECYRLVLGEIARNPDSPLGVLPMLTDGDRRQLADWNVQTISDNPREVCVHELVEAQVRRAPTAVACAFAGRELTYAELDARANQIAAKLREIGIGRGKLVGLCLERSLDLLVGLLGILKSGAGYVPLDPGYPSERLHYMVQDSGMPALITSSELERELAFPVGNVLCLDRDAQAIDAESAEPLPRSELSATPDSIAYVIYTSGSTGKPKGVLVPHRAVVNLLCSVAKKPGLTPDDVVLAITTLSFDIAVSEIWLPLVVGAKIVLVGREVAADGGLLRNVCERENVTFIDATPATYRLLLGAGWQGSDRLTLICTGEAMPKDLAQELPNRGKHVWNGYGPTETTVWSTFYEVPKNCRRVLIGRPVDNTFIYILDARKQHVPIGVTGEIYIAGSGVTAGYLNRPDLTADRFLPDPFDPNGGPMYRTGDVGRYLANGDIECLGRNDNQVKLRGFRIELGEIEDALTHHAEINEAAVILREDRPGDAKLVAYAVARGHSMPPAAELRAHLQKSLPDYMVPAVYVGMPRMPLTPSGKIDRRALPAPDASHQQSAGDFVAPRSDTERLLAELWAAALNVGRVSIDDDFFALGGHSLLASQILARLRRDHGIELSFRKFFEAPTVARLAELIDGVPVAERSASGGIKRQADGIEVPLSLAQERLWLLEEMHPAQRLVHNLPAAWRLQGPVDLALLQRSLDLLAQRHEMLRMTIATGKDNRATQHIAKSVDLTIEFVDLRSFPSAERESRMHQQIHDTTAIAFELTRLPLFRSTLFQLDDSEYVYYSVRHNIIWDGWSFDIFLRDLSEIYNALANDEQPALKDLPVRYSDFVLWHREWVKGPELARQIAFWQERLSGTPADLNLPHDHRRPAQSTYSGANTAITLSREEGDALTAVAHRAGTTVFNLMFAAYSIVLSRFSGQQEIVVGTPVRARTQPELEDIIGPFINAIVLRCNIDPELPFIEYLAKVRDIALDAFSNQEMPLELLGSRPPVVRAFFSYQDARSRPRSFGTARISQINVEPPAAANDIMLWIMERPQEVVAVANFSTEVFELATIQRILKSFVELLRDVIAEPTRKIGALRLLAPHTQVDSSPASTRHHQDSYVHHRLIELEAAEPNAVSYNSGNESLTNQELLAKARALATELRKSAGPQSVVGIALPGSLDFMVAVMGTLIAGCCVLPIDLESPQPYIDRVLACTRPTAIVTRSAERDRFAGSAKVVDIQTIATSTEEFASGLELPPTTLPAWLNVHFSASSAPVLSPVTHATLNRQLAALADFVGNNANSFVSLIDPLSESLPLALFLGLTLGRKSVLVDVQERERVSAAVDIEASDGAAVAVFTSAELGCDLGEMSRSQPERLAVLLYGRADEATLQRLMPRTDRLITISSAAPPHPVIFARVVQRSDEGWIAGRALAPYEVAALDAARARVPEGVVGELWLESPTPVPLGLRGRVRHRDQIELLENRQERVTIEGFRFDPNEIAVLLEKHPAIACALVRVVTADDNRERLVAYYVPKPGEAFTETTLRRHIRAALPKPMVPQSFVEISQIPMASDGSIDEPRLPSPFAAEGRDDYVAPRNESEQLVAELYADALGLPRVGIYDNFFDLGGHSLLCFRVIERIEQRIGRRLNPRVLLLNTLEQVAAELGSPSRSARVVTAPETDESMTGRILKKFQGFLKR